MPVFNNQPFHPDFDLEFGDLTTKSNLNKIAQDNAFKQSGINLSNSGITPPSNYAIVVNGSVFDDRIQKVVAGRLIKPGLTSDSYFGNFYETPEESLRAADERESGNADEDEKIREWGAKRAQQLAQIWPKGQKEYIAPRSFIHPYALLTLYGGLGGPSYNTSSDLYDRTARRRYYEMDGDATGGYAKNPTTTAIINWGNQDDRHRFPYAFTDFVFCKYWNRIQNNRMITLRRYPMPVPDSAEPANYNRSGSTASIAEASKDAFSPMATAVTYFGEGTGNSLKEILKFAVGYEWKEIEGDIWKTTSQQNESGQSILGGAGGFFGSGLSQIIVATGLLDDLTGAHRIVPTDAVSIGPDPYSNGPYENRIIGPINVINKVYRRERGLKFTGDGLNITFEYVARPISGVNNKAIMIDLMSNMLTMTASSGTFFGGAHRYRTEKPAVYPMRDTYSLTQLYKGNIFGHNGAPAILLRNAFSETNVSFMTNFAKELLDEIGAIAQNFLGKLRGQDGTSSAPATTDRGDTGTHYALDQLKGTAGRAVAAHMLKGASIPWLENARALLTGEAIGDWHLTIGSPLNPIAMIGNLIVDSCDFEMGEELGPDDFPTSFKAIVHLKHAMGRDRDAVMSMFNRGYGRTYSLPDRYKTSSADYQTVVDNYTDQDIAGTYKIGSNPAGTKSSGRDELTEISVHPLVNSGATYNAELKGYNLKIEDFVEPFKTDYGAMGWQMKWTL